MMERLDRSELYRRCGHESQLYGARTAVLEDGAGRGSRVVEVWTADGLAFDLTADSGLDMGRLSYRGVNMAYVTKNGSVSPYRHLPVPGEFDHSFPGGMLFTCGLLNVGPECRDDGRGGDGEFHGLHGRFHGLTAENVGVRLEGDELVVQGTLRETEQWRHNLVVRRTWRVPVWGSSVRLEDEIENLTPEPAELMCLYHVNFGWPMLSPATRLHLPARHVTPRTAWAASGLAEQCRFSMPGDGVEEQVYFNENCAVARAQVENPELGLVCTLTWSIDTLPVLSQWKTMRSGEYALGLEPSTCHTAGRAAERAAGGLVKLESWAVRRHWVELSFADSEARS